MRTALPPRARTERTLMAGVVRGMTMVAEIPSRAAPSATPWAWLPALAAITPRSARSGSRWISLL
jgi:hypothetical protein